MSEHLCDHCGDVALTNDGGQPVTVQQTAVIYEGESGYRVRDLPMFGATYCSMRCAADALSRHGSRYY